MCGIMNIITKPRILVRNKREAEIFVSELSKLDIRMYEDKSEVILREKAKLLQSKINKKSKDTEIATKNIFAHIGNYNDDLSIILNFIPERVKPSFETYLPFVSCIKIPLFEKIKLTKNKVTAFAYPLSNHIIITEGYVARFVHSCLIHEFLHYASGLGSDWHLPKTPWLIEGITELYTKRLAAEYGISYEPHNRYEEYVRMVLPIETSVGEKELKALYFKGDGDPKLKNSWDNILRDFQPQQ
jgi:hypothetical protein